MKLVEKGGLPQSDGRAVGALRSRSAPPRPLRPMPRPVLPTLLGARFPTCSRPYIFTQPLSPAGTARRLASSGIGPRWRRGLSTTPACPPSRSSTGSRSTGGRAPPSS
eukprot:1607106-Prymnesium_polylepis.1